MEQVRSGTAAGFLLRIGVPKTFEPFGSTRNRLEFHDPANRNQKFPSLNCASSTGNLDRYQIIRRPLATESAMRNLIENNTLVFVVDVRAGKKEIGEAIESVFDVETKKVNTMIRPDRRKKVYVMLKPEHKAVDVAKRLGIL